MRSSGIRRAYERAKLFRKMMLIIFFSVCIAVFLWAIPWLPYGLSVEDYNDRLTLLMLLIFAACVSAFGAVYMREFSDRMERTVETWTTVHDGLSDLHRREYFYDRVVAECERSQGLDTQFTVLAVGLEREPANGAVPAVETAMSSLGMVIKDNDLMAVLGAHEIGVLAPKVGQADAAAFAESLRRVLTATSAEGGADVRVGWAVYDWDAQDAAALVGLARERLSRVGAKPAAAA